MAMRRAWSVIPPPLDRQLDNRKLQWLTRLVLTLGQSLATLSPDRAPTGAEVETLSRKLAELRLRLPCGKPG